MPKLNISVYPTSEYERNISTVYARSTDADITAGRAWYQNAHDTARTIAGNVETGAGILAAFSPMMEWKRNVELATSAIERNRFTGHIFSANNRKARKIWDGAHPLDVLGGQKVRAFYSNILHAGRTDDVCVDRHAWDVALGKVQTDEERDKNRLPPKRYRTVAQAYRNVARKNGLTGSEMQAIVWVTWRREKGITA